MLTHYEPALLIILSAAVVVLFIFSAANRAAITALRIELEDRRREGVVARAAAKTDSAVYAAQKTLDACQCGRDVYEPPAPPESSELRAYSAQNGLA